MMEGTIKATRYPIKVGDTVYIRKVGQFVKQNGQLYYEQPPDDHLTIKSQAELDRIKGICGSR